MGGVFTATVDGRDFVVASNSVIASDIMNGYADFAIWGSDKFGELEKTTSLRYQEIGKQACRFVLALPKDRLRESRRLMIATSYPRSLARFILASGIDACVGPVRPGKVEGAVAQGIADGVYDIFQTGTTLEANNLEVVAQGEEITLGALWLH